MRDTVTTPDGRTLEILLAGPEGGRPYVYHAGTPSAVTEFPAWDPILEDLDLRMMTFSRPGYGGSTPHPEDAEPTIADDVTDTATILDALGWDEFVTLGWSGGGPRALGCAALMPDRCKAVLSLAGVAPYGDPGLDWFGDMGLENVRDFLASLLGKEMARPFIEPQTDFMKDVTADQVLEGLGGLVDEVDAGAITGELADYLAGTMRRAAEQGVVGLLDDGMQIVRPWGYAMRDITVPTAVWQGRHDKMVPFAHGVWLADQIPGARRHLFDDEGHVTLVNRMRDLLTELTEMAGWA